MGGTEWVWGGTIVGVGGTEWVWRCGLDRVMCEGNVLRGTSGSKGMEGKEDERKGGMGTNLCIST